MGLWLRFCLQNKNPVGADAARLNTKPPYTWRQRGQDKLQWSGGASSVKEEVQEVDSVQNIDPQIVGDDDA